MTHNQIEYANYKESKRHNIAGETELNRHNVVTEYETARHNVETENIGWANLAETKRHNQADETETHRYHTASEAIEKSKLSETTRHNKVVEQIDSYRTVNEVAIGYQNASTNAYNAQTNAYNAQTNRGNMRINEFNAYTNRKSALAKAHYDNMNAETARFEALQKQKSVSIEEYKSRLEKVKTEINKALTDSTIDKNKAEASLTRYQKYLKEAELLIKKKQQKHTARHDWAKLPADYISALGKVVSSALVLLK